MSPTKAHEAWRKIADHYTTLAATRAGKEPGVQLACLVLAEYCAHLWAGSSGGPTLAMVALAEHIIGVPELLDAVDEAVTQYEQCKELS